MTPTARAATGQSLRRRTLRRRPARRPPGALELQEQLRRCLQTFGLRPPPLGTLAPLLGLSLAEAAAALAQLAALGQIVQVARNRFFLPETLQALMQVARETAAAAPDGRFDAGAFRDRSGVGRNLAIELLEYFDQLGFTRFADERRRIADGAAVSLPTPVAVPPARASATSQERHGPSL